MLTVEDYVAIRRAHRDGKPIKQIVREFGHARNTVRKALRQPQPGPPPATRERPAPVLGPFHATIDRILASALRDSNSEVRWQAAEALGRIGPAAAEAMPALTAALTDSNHAVRAHAADALKAIRSAATVSADLPE